MNQTEFHNLAKELHGMEFPEYMKVRIIKETERRLAEGRPGRLTKSASVATESSVSGGFRKRVPNMMTSKQTFTEKRDVSHLSENNFWKIPLEQHKFQSCIEFPLVWDGSRWIETWTIEICRNWILTLADAVRRQKPNVPANFAVVGNSAAKFLYTSTNNTLKIKDVKVLSGCVEIYWINMNDRSRGAPDLPLLVDYLRPLLPVAQKIYESFPFGPVTISNLKDVRLLTHYFKRDKPTFNTLVKYYEGDEVDTPLLRTSINNVYKKQKDRILYYRGTPLVMTKQIEIYRDEFQNSLLLTIMLDFILGQVPMNRLHSIQASMDLNAANWDKELTSRIVEQGGDSPPSLDSFDELTRQDNIITLTYLDMCVGKRKFDQLGPVLLPQGMADYFAEFLSDLNSECGDSLIEITKVVSALIAMYDCKSITGVVSVLTLYCVSIPGIRDYIKFTMVNAGFEIQGEEDEKKSFFDWDFMKTYVLDCGRELWQLIAVCFVSLIGEKYLPSNWMTVTGFSPSSFSAEVLKHCMKLSVKTVAEYVFSLIMVVINKVKACVESKSLLPLLDPSRDPSTWKFECDAVNTYLPELVAQVGTADSSKRLSELRAKGLIPMHIKEPLTNLELRDYVDILYIRGLEISKNVKGTLLSRDIDMTLNKMRALQSMNSNNYGVMAARIQPLGIFITGPAGVGKTNLSTAIYRSLGKKRGYEVDPTSVYTWQTNVNFQDGFGPCHWVVCFDDVDQTVATPVAGVPDHVTSIISVINNAPLPVEQSDVALKGKICAKPLLAIQTSNYKNGRLVGYSLCPAAYWRRFPIVIDVSVKPGYGKDSDPTILETEKVLESEDNEYLNLDVFCFTKMPAENSFTRPHTPVKRMTRSELFVYLHRKFDVHLKQQMLMISIRTLNSNTCPICFADLRDDGTGCSCKQQGKTEIVTALISIGILTGGILAKRYLDNHINWFKRKTLLLIEDAETTMDAFHMELLRFQQLRDKVLSFIPMGVGIVAVLVLVKVLTRTMQRMVVQGRDANTVEGFIPPTWKRAQQDFTPGLPSFNSTFTLQDIENQLVKSYCVVSGADTMRGVCVAHNAVLTCTHAIKNAPIIKIRHQGVTYSVTNDEFNVRVVLNDMSIILVQGLAGASSVTSKFWEAQDMGISVFDEVIVMGEDKQYVTTLNKMSSIANYGPVIMTNAATVNGDCGMVYVGRINKSWRILGLHVLLAAGIPSPIQATAQVVTGQQIKATLASLATIPQGISVPELQTCVTPELQRFTQFPAKSEYWAAVSHHGFEAHSLGTAVIQVHGATMRSQVTPTLFAEDFRDLEEEWCGRQNYWQPPVFKGEMREDKWCSPYVNSLIPLKRGARRSDYYWLSFVDYVLPFHKCLCDGYRILSAEEAIVGIDGSVIHAVDKTTSIGMPYNQKKSGFIAVVDKQAFIDPRIQQSFDEFMTHLRGDSIPVPIILGMLKDEQVSYKKNAALMTRVFNCLPFSYNWIMKIYLGPIGAFMRSNCILFESMVGIDMTSLECNRVVDILKRVDPGLTRTIDLDFVKQDKSEDGESLDFTAKVLFYVGNLIGLPEPLLCYKLIHGLRNGIFVYKNDFFIIGATNSSGNDKTVEINSIDNSLSQRYVYYRMKYPDGLPEEIVKILLQIQRNFMENPSCMHNLDEKLFTFREDVALATYGDDANSAVAPHCTFYDPTKIVALGAERGMVYTAGDKSAEIKFIPLAQLTFLQRKFVWDSELGFYKAPISKKSLAKMLVLSKRSTLSKVDHGAAILSDVMREAVYHGKEFYDFMYMRVRDAARKHNIEHSSYYYVPLYEEYWEKVRQGGFRTWRCEPQIEIEESFKMQGQERIELKDAVSAPEEIRNVEAATYELGQLHASNTIMESGVASATAIAKLPKTELGKFLNRLTAIATLNLLSTDAALSNLVNYDPWDLYLLNPSVADKVTDFSYIRSQMEIIISVVAPAGAYGMYVIYAIPQGYGQDLPDGAVSVSVDTCLQMPHMLVDLSASCDGKLELDWIFPMDYATVKDDGLGSSPRGMWTIRVSCLTPIASGMGAVTPSATVKFWARCAEDVELVIPFQQGFNDDVRSATGGSKLSDMSRGASTQLSKLNSIPIIGSFSKPLAAGASAVTSILDYFGFSRTAEQQMPTTVVQRPYSNVANIDCNDSSEYAALSNSNSISIDPGIVLKSHQDEASFKFLFEKWTLVGTFPWAVSDAQGAILFRFPVTPFVSRVALTTGGTLTTAGYVGLPFMYWVGDMEYKFLIPVSMLHRGVLQVSWCPEEGIAGDITNVQLNHILDVVAGKSFSFDVGYAREIPMIEGIPVTATIPAPMNHSIMNGCFRVTVVNPLTSQNATAGTTILVFARAKENMQFAVPREQITMYTNATTKASYPFMSSFQIQGSGALGDETVDDEHFELVPCSGMYPIKEVCCGENFRSVRGLMQKFTQVPAIGGEYFYSAQPTCYVPHLPVFPISGQSTYYGSGSATAIPTVFSWAGYYSCMYVGVAYSTRYKIVNTATDSDGYQPWSVSHGSLSRQYPLNPVDMYSMLAPVWCVKPGEAVEVTVPWYYNRKYLKGYVAIKANNAAIIGSKYTRVDCIMGLNRSTVSASHKSVVVYTAASSDIRVHKFRVTPPIKFVPNTFNGFPYGNTPNVPGLLADQDSDAGQREAINLDGVVANLVLDGDVE